jgi:hypothetical protein
MRKRGAKSMGFNPSTSTNGVGEETRDRALWLAVINQQIEDATSPIVVSDPKEKKRLELQRQQARSWLLNPNPDFNEVCALAEVEPDHIRRAAKARIEAFDADPHDRVKSYTYEGKTLTAAEWSALSGVPARLINSRLYAGWSIDEAIGATPRPSNVPVYTYDGLTLTLKQWAERVGLSHSTLAHRINTGWEFGLALTTKPDKTRNRYGAKTMPFGTAPIARAAR